MVWFSFILTLWSHWANVWRTIFLGTRWKHSQRTLGGHILMIAIHSIYRGLRLGFSLNEPITWPEARGTRRRWRDITNTLIQKITPLKIFHLLLGILWESLRPFEQRIWEQSVNERTVKTDGQWTVCSPCSIKNNPKINNNNSDSVVATCLKKQFCSQAANGVMAKG